jgi:hypothetical protein
MAIFGQNPHKVIDTYSQQLEREFLEHLAMRHAPPFSLQGQGLRH